MTLKKESLKTSFALIVSLLALAGVGAEAYGKEKAKAGGKSKAKSESATSPAAEVAKAVAVLHPTEGNNVHGVVTFVKAGDKVKVTVHIEGLTPGKHGFHIHEFGDCSSKDGSAAGGHFNPATAPHGAPEAAQRHTGDLGNIEANKEGVAHVEFTDSMMKFDGPHSILGRGVIVHTNPDDLKTQPTGNAGGRQACGVIGVAKP
jgi:Cu-Zn family superoxide dismutase